MFILVSLIQSCPLWVWICSLALLSISLTLCFSDLHTSLKRHRGFSISPSPGSYQEFSAFPSCCFSFNASLHKFLPNLFVNSFICAAKNQKENPVSLVTIVPTGSSRAYTRASLHVFMVAWLLWSFCLHQCQKHTCRSLLVSTQI